jgi:uncharacterized protein (TIGR03435 family)
MAAARILVVGMLVSAIALSAEQREQDGAGASASFEVASVKPNNSGTQGSGVLWQPSGALNATNVTLKSLIARAYEVREFQVDGPGWLEFARFDIAARAREGTPDQSRPAMLRSLLTERFKLTAHFETREQQPVFALVLRSGGRLGPQLKKSQVVCSGPAATSTGFCGLNTSVGRTGGRVTGGGITMDNVAAAIANYAVDQTVVNRTGLEGTFDFELQFTRETSGTSNQLPPDAPSIFTAVQEQLGLRLETARGPVQFLVIDSVQQPTPD